MPTIVYFLNQESFRKVDIDIIPKKGDIVLIDGNKYDVVNRPVYFLRELYPWVGIEPIHEELKWGRNRR